MVDKAISHTYGTHLVLLSTSLAESFLTVHQAETHPRSIWTLDCLHRSSAWRQKLTDTNEWKCMERVWYQKCKKQIMCNKYKQDNHLALTQRVPPQSEFIIKCPSLLISSSLTTFYNHTWNFVKMVHFTWQIVYVIRTHAHHMSITCNSHGYHMHTTWILT